jgi:hypothetical protein
MKAFQQLLNYAAKNKDVLSNVAIGSGVNALLGGLAEGPTGAIKYGLSDLLISYPATLGARKLAGGPVTETLLKNGQQITRKVPSGLENTVNVGASIIGPMVTDVAFGTTRAQPVPTDMSQQQQIAQQLLQRDMINNDPTMALFPGTMLQAQGAESTLFRDFLAQMPSLEEVASRRRQSFQPIDYMQQATELRRIA